MNLILDDVKNYLRVDSDLTEDDAQIQTLIDAAKLYIVQQTGKTYVDDGLYNQAIKLLVSHWYENRELNPSKPGQLAEFPHSLSALINHISTCSAYAYAEGIDV